MENFKEIAEKCFAGELSGTFVLRDNRTLHSKCLIKMKGCLCPYYIDGYYYSDNGNCYIRHLRQQNNDVIDFIPDNMQEQIKIDIPEGKVPVMESTEKGVVITWKEKELTYDDVCKELQKHRNIIGNPIDNSLSDVFHKKAWTIRKLTNIRNYFGKPKHNTYGHALYYTIERGIHTTPALYPSNDQRVIFDTKEQAEQAIKMLGDELKYLFEPW